MSHKSKQGSRMLDPIPVPAYLWEMETERFIAWNEALGDLIGYSNDELRVLDWRDLVVPDEIATARRAIEAGPIMGGVRWHWRTKDGRIIAVTLASREMRFVDDDRTVHDVLIALVVQVGDDASLTANVVFP